MKTATLFALCLVSLTAGWCGAAGAASFDCSKAASPFEHAICDNPELSRADERLATTYATATGGLSEPALKALRSDQRTWLDFAQRACTRDNRPMSTGRYSEDGVSCLVSTFAGRSDVLETSRMISGQRFYPLSRYATFLDPDGVGNDDYYWPVATHQFSFAQLDGSDAAADAFNAFVAEQVDALAGASGGEPGEGDQTSDTSNSITVKDVDERMITLDVTTYWYGHGAAHGNYTISLIHYLRDKQRALEASDVFGTKGWQKALLGLVVDELKAEHGEDVMLDSPGDIADIVTDPTRWDLSDPYGLVIQFEPYEVAAYAYGAPTVRIPWAALEAYRAEDADGFRYGY